MKKTKLDRLISLIREEMMTTGSTAGKPGFSSKADSEGPTAGFDFFLCNMIKSRPTPLGRYRTRVNWMKKGES